MCEQREHYEPVFASEVGRLCYQCTRRGQEQQSRRIASGFLLSGDWVLNDRGRLLIKKAISKYLVESERGSGLARLRY